MRRFALTLAAAFVLGIGFAIGMTPSPAQASDPPCFVKCKNGFESVCCPGQQCIQTEPPTPC